MSCFSGDYADPKDVATIPPKLPERPKSGLSTKSVAMSSRNMKIQPKKGKLVQPSSKTSKNSAKFKKPSSKMSSKFSPMFQPCVNVNQRRVVKYNLLLSISFLQTCSRISICTFRLIQILLKRFQNKLNIKLQHVRF